MAVCEETNRRINRNRDYMETFTFTDCDGNTRDLTGFDFILELRKTVNAADPALSGRPIREAESGRCHRRGRRRALAGGGPLRGDLGVA